MRRPKPAPGEPETRDLILDAAQRIAAERGAGHVTLDAVARTSGLSKGGVLYHFPNKDALINGMLERMLAHSQHTRSILEAELADRPHPVLRALLRSRDTHYQTLDPDVAMAVLAAAAEKPELLEPMRAQGRQLYKRIVAQHREGDLELNMLLWAAADGLLFQKLLGLSPLSEPQRLRLEQRLLTLADEVLR